MDEDRSDVSFRCFVIFGRVGYPLLGCLELEFECKETSKSNIFIGLLDKIGPF